MVSAGANKKYEYQITNLLIEDCNFTNTTSQTSTSIYGAIIIRTFKNLTIRNNYFNNLRYDAIRIGEKVHKWEDQRVTEGNVLIEGNTFGSDIPGSHIVIFRPDDLTKQLKSCVIKDNIFYNHMQAGTHKREQGAYIFNECFKTNIGVNYWEDIPDGETYIYFAAKYDVAEQKTISELN